MIKYTEGLMDRVGELRDIMCEDGPLREKLRKQQQTISVLMQGHMDFMKIVDKRFDDMKDSQLGLLRQEVDQAQAAIKRMRGEYG